MATTPADTTEYLTRQEILDKDDLLEDDVQVPEWGGVVRVRGLSGRQRDKYEASLLDSKNRVKVLDARAKLAQLSIIDRKTGQLLFGEDDIKALSLKSARALARVVDMAQKLAGLTDEDLEELEGE